MDNVDSKAEDNFSLNELHGYVLSVTNHLSHDKRGMKWAPIKPEPSDTSNPKLPDSYVMQPPVELAETDVFAPRLDDSKVRPLLDVQGAKVKDEAWMARHQGGEARHICRG